MKRSKGFTLIEVMLALMVVAVGVTALLVRIMSTVDSTAYLREKTVASWVAENQLELELLANEHSNALFEKEKSGETEMAGRRWFWRIKSTKPPDAAANQFRQLDVSVYAERDDDSSIITVKGLIDSHHRLK